MAIHHLNLAENPLKPNKFQAYPQKANGISLWAFLLSIFVYLSIFYIFNLSPSSLLNNTKFWFFISNTLILIIAADFGAFSSSSRKQAELYEEYVKNSRANSAKQLSSFKSQYREISKKSIPPQKGENSKEIQEKIKEAVHVIIAPKNESPENKLQIVVKSYPNKSNEKFQENMPQLMTPKAHDEAKEEGKNEARCVRSTSDRAIQFKDTENRIALRRTESEKHEIEEEEENEFSSVSNEELNRRVEEFIRKFKRQIRFQATQNRIHQI